MTTLKPNLLMKTIHTRLFSHHRPLLLAATVFSLASFASQGISFGASRAWNSGNTSGFWGVASNWSGNAVPTIADGTYFNYDESTPIDISMTGSRNALSINGRGNETVNFNFGSSTNLTVANDITAGQIFSSQDRWAVLNFVGPNSGTASLNATGASTGRDPNSGIRISGNITANFSTQVRVGNSDATVGGTYFEINNGATVSVTNNLTTYTAATSQGVNRISVINGNLTTGSILLGNTLASSINSRGRLQMGTAGKITAGNIDLRERSYFEAEGSGLTATVNMTARIGDGVHDGGGTLLIGLRDTPRSVASTLTLGNSTINMGNQTVIEMSLFSGSSSDQIDFLSSGYMTLNGTVHLNFSIGNSYTPVENDSWTLFTGDTNNITGSGAFDVALPTLDPGLAWDQSDFNQAGGWQLSVVPEPTTVLLLGLGAALLLAKRRKSPANS